MSLKDCAFLERDERKGELLEFSTTGASKCYVFLIDYDLCNVYSVPCQFSCPQCKLWLFGNRPFSVIHFY